MRVMERTVFQTSGAYDAELGVKRSFSLYSCKPTKITLQGSSKGGSFPSPCFLNRLLPATVARQCDSCISLAFSASASPEPKPGPGKCLSPAGTQHTYG